MKEKIRTNHESRKRSNLGPCLEDESLPKRQHQEDDSIHENQKEKLQHEVQDHSHNDSGSSLMHSQVSLEAGCEDEIKQAGSIPDYTPTSKGVMTLPTLGPLVLDDTATPNVVVSSDFSSQMKTHQREGIQFMYNALFKEDKTFGEGCILACLLYTSTSPRDLSTSRMPSSA